MNHEIIFRSLPEVLSYGEALAGASNRIAVGRCTENSAAESALCAGIIKGGADVILMGRCIKPAVFLASRISDCGLCICIKDSGIVKIETEEKSGMPLTDKVRDLIQNASEKKNIPEGKITDASILRKIYFDNLKKLIPEKSPYKISVSSSCGFRETFGPDKGDEIVIQLSSDGTKASLYSEKSGFISYSGLVLICCLDLFEKGCDAALPYDFSFAADRIAAEKGRKVLRYFSYGSGTDDSEARKLAAGQRFTTDGLFLALNAVKILTEKNISLSEAADFIPKAHSLKKYVSVDCSCIESFLSSKKGKRTPDGTAFSEKNGRVLMRPSESGKGLWLSVESYSAETASEICGKIEETLRKFQH
ncbi:MAG: hypothetical protein ACI4I9_10290 [Porcipelethomonas sp.]